MRYHYREGVRRDRKKPTWIIWLFFTAGLAFASYMAANYMAPRLVSMPLSAKATPDATMNKLKATLPKDQEKHLYIPQLNVDLPIESDNTSLKDSAWLESEGNPENGESLTVKGLRFSLGATPWETRNASPFYNLDRLQPGYELYVDHDGKRMAYRVKALHSEPPVQQTASEEKSTLFLVPVNEQGEFAGGVVVEAESAGVVATTDQEQNYQ